MSILVEAHKRATVPIIVRMRARERDLLKDVLFEEGISSMSSWFRQLAVCKLRECGVILSQNPDDTAGNGDLSTSIRPLQATEQGPGAA
jgi:hypothetical protein